MRRSRSAGTASRGWLGAPASEASRDRWYRSSRAVDALAIKINPFPSPPARALSSVVPRDPKAKSHLQNAKTGGHKRIAPVCRSKKRDTSDGHEAKAHHRNDTHGKCAAGHNRRAIKKKPNPRKSSVRTGLEQRKRQQASDQNRRRKTEQKLASGSGKERGIRAMRFRGSRRCGNRHGNEGFDKPDRQPGTRRVLSRRDDRCGDCRKAHGHAAPAGHGGELRGAFHGLANVAEMVGGTSIDGNGLAVGRAQRTGAGHKNNLGRGG